MASIEELDNLPYGTFLMLSIIKFNPLKLFVNNIIDTQFLHEGFTLAKEKL